MLKSVIYRFDVIQNAKMRGGLMVNEDLMKWIKSELTVDISEELAKYKDDVKDFVRLTPSGEILLTHNQSSLTAKEKISLYMIGKLYSSYAEFSKERTVTNKELEDALGFPEGTVRTSLFALRKDKSIVSVEDGVHKMKFDRIGEILEKIKGKKKNGGKVILGR